RWSPPFSLCRPVPFTEQAGTARDREQGGRNGAVGRLGRFFRERRGKVDVHQTDREDVIDRLAREAFQRGTYPIRWAFPCRQQRLGFGLGRRRFGGLRLLRL